MSSVTAAQTDFYRKLRTIEPSTLTDEMVEEAMAERVSEGSIKDPELVRKSFRLLHRVARNVTEEEWNEYMTDGQLPPMKLTPEEMELVRGGVFCLTAFVAGVTIGLGIVGLFAAGAALSD